jgi:tetratricopeptide (TPR) repeat protein
MIRLLLLLFTGLLASGAILDAGVRAETRSGWRRLQDGAAADMASGSLPLMLRAQLVTTRALLARPEDLAMQADAAYVNAALACDHGMPTLPGARAALATLAASPGGDRVGVARLRREEPVAGGSGPFEGPEVSGLGARLASEAWLALCRGDRVTAMDLAREAAQRDRQDPRPLLVLARAHLGRGELTAAAHVTEAAQVRSPGAAYPLVLWAEARLEAGQSEGAIEALRQALARAPGHARALLLLEQALQATGADAVAVARERLAACARDGRHSPALAASCELAAAVENRRLGQRAAAIAQARAVAGNATADSHDRAVAVLLLAQLGEVDAAAQLQAALPRREDEQLPSRAWADIALALGRGEPPPPILPPTPVHPETRLCAARAVLASDGLDALGGLLAAGTIPAAAHPDLQALAAATTREPVDLPPAQAYAGALRALAANDPPAAGRLLSHALTGHADACRAAGLYLPILALTGRGPEDALEPLRAVNRGCVELAWTE